jgi:choline dehydrogenase-like flavoprotein
MASVDTKDLPDDAVVVIGGGPCGGIAATQLLAAGLDVVLLDSGVRAPAGIVVKVAGRTVFRWVDRRHLHVNRQVSATDPKTEWYSSLSLGGLSNYWTGAVPRFAPDDFTEGARLDERYEWPIRYEDLEPYYAVAERLLRATGGPSIPTVPPGETAFTAPVRRQWTDVLEQASAAGFPMGFLPRAKGRPWMLALQGNEFDSYHNVIAPAVRRGGLRLVRGAHVLRLLHRDGTATGVEYLDGGSGAVKTIRGRAFVVAAGALDSTEILMRSATPELPQGLGSSSGVLGRYIHDHPREWYPVRFDRKLPALVDPLYLARAAAEVSPPLMAAQCTIGLASGRDRLRTFYGGATDMAGIQTFGTMVPSPEHGISLVGSNEQASTASRLHIDLVYDEAVVRNMEESRSRLRDAFAAAGIRAELGPFHDLAPGSSVHVSGTARMHRKREYGAVDEWNRLFDAPNVIVVDSACFTTGVEKNPALTAMAIAARAAHHLAVAMTA